jgi:hypothetical protein
VQKLNHANQYLVSKITEERTRKKIQQVLVYWEGYKDPTWIPFTNLSPETQTAWKERRNTDSSTSDVALYVCGKPSNEEIQQEQAELEHFNLFNAATWDQSEKLDHHMTSDGENDCHTEKGNSETKGNKIAGIMIWEYNCNITQGMQELYVAEGKQQVFSFF